MKKINIGFVMALVAIVTLTSCGSWTDESRTESINSCVEKYKASFESMKLGENEVYDEVYLDACKCIQEKIEEKYRSPSAFEEEAGGDHHHWTKGCFDIDKFMKEATGMGNILD